MSAAPAVLGVIFLVLWEALVRLTHTPPYLVPGPIATVEAFVADPWTLLGSLLATLTETVAALALGTLTGVLLALATMTSRWVRDAVQPWAVILQVTPIIAIAPLIGVWIGDPFRALVVCATIVAFFPVFSNTVAGLSSAAPELLDLFRLNGAGRWRTVWLLHVPSAVPSFVTGLRVSGGLALVGAVVGEFVSQSGGFASGLGTRILESSFRAQMPRVFASLVLLSASGITIYLVLGRFGQWLLRRRGAG